jgi:LuxR family maltose regulon positive regulatory protein
MRSEAIAHSLAAKDWGQAAELIERAMNDMMRQGEFFTTMLDRLRALPEEVIRARPHFGISYAWLLQISLQPDEVEPRLREVEATWGDRLPPDLRLEIDVIRASVARQRRDVTTALRLSNRVLDALPANAADDSPLQREARTGAVFNLGHTYFYLLGDVVKGGHYYAEALAISQAASSLTLTMAAMSGLAQVQVLQGELQQAAETYRQGLARVEQGSSVGSAPAAAYMHIGLGGLLYEQNELDKAARHLAQGVELCRQWRIGDSWCEGLLFQARLKQAHGDAAGALHAIRQAEGLPRDYQAGPRYGGPVAACRALLALRNAETASRSIDPGRLRVVEEWVEERGLDVDRPIVSLDDEFEHLVWARVLIAQGKPGPALRLLARLLPKAEACRRTGRAIEIQALQALAHRACGDIEQALAALEQALVLAEPKGYVRTFVDEGAPMFELFRSLSARPLAVSAEYIGSLVDAVGSAGTADAIPEPEPEPGHWPLEPLTQREMEVLRLLRTDLAVSEIAQELHISVNTVKTHIKRIYSKLGAHSRYEAVVRAEGLDLMQ